MEVHRAGLDDLDLVAPLFDAYRRFYDQPADLARARAYLADRLTRNEAVIFLALDGGTAVGFTLLYPTFSSVSAAPIFTLADLFVDPQSRRGGVGRALLDAARRHAKAAGAHHLQLETARTNTTAQRLYESTGWKRDEVFLTYALDL